MNKSKVENGEVIEAFREKFNELVVKESSGEYYAMILPKDIHEDDEYSLIEIEAFITNALNQQRRNTIKEISELFKKSFVTTDVYLVTRFLDKLTKLEK